MTDCAADLFAHLADAARVLPPVHVRALHLPKADAAGRPSGKFCALELSDGALGLSYLRLDDTFDALLAELGGAGPAGLAGVDALAIARGVLEPGGARRALGFAAANALSQSLMTRAGLVFEPDADSLAQMAPQAGDEIGLVGFFPPLIPRILASGATLTVIELDPALAGAQAGYHVTLDPAALSRCNKVLSTSTILLNNTVDDILHHARQAAWFGLIGPGAGGLPDALFARGVSRIGSVWVTDRDGFVAAIAAGEKWGKFATKYVLRRETYPGAERLIEAAARSRC